MKQLTSIRLLAGLVLIGMASCESTSQNHYSNPKSSDAAKTSGSSSSSSSSTAASAFKASSKSAGMSGASLAFPTGDRKTSTILLEKVAPAEVQGGKFDYQIRVTNLTSLDLDNVVVEETFSGNVAMGKTIPASMSSKPGTGMFDLGSLGPNEVKTINVQGSTQGDGTISTCSTVSYNSGLCMTMEAVSPKLALAAAGPAEASICDAIEAKYVVTNNGSGTARDVVVKGSLPEGMTTKSGMRSFEKSIGDLAPGQSREFAVPAEVSKQGSFQYSAMATADGGLTAQANNVMTRVSQPILAITKTGATKSFVGRSIRYEINVTNRGTGAAENTIVEDVIPANCTLKSASEGATISKSRVRWNVGTLQPNQSRKFVVELKAAKLGDVSATATAKAECADAVQAPAHTMVSGIPAILLEVIDLEDPIVVGENETYDIKVTNQGSAPGTGIKIVATIPDNVTFVSAKGPTTGSQSGSTVTFAPLASLAPGAEVTWKVTVRGTRALDARFRVAMNSDQLTSPVDESEATNFYE